MQYQNKTFTLPAAPKNQSQKDWDRIWLSPEQFAAKYSRSTIQAQVAPFPSPISK